MLSHALRSDKLSNFFVQPEVYLVDNDTYTPMHIEGEQVVGKLSLEFSICWIFKALISLSEMLWLYCILMLINVNIHLSLTFIEFEVLHYCFPFIEFDYLLWNINVASKKCHEKPAVLGNCKSLRFQKPFSHILHFESTNSIFFNHPYLQWANIR